MGRWQNKESGAIVSVADAKDDRFDAGWTSLAKGEKPPKSETPDDTWTNKELDAFAVEKNIDMGGAKNKPDRLAALAEGKQLAPAGE